MRIVFMGTPSFAIPSLEKLLASHHQVVGVVTTPDKPAGRGKKLRPSPVKEVALKHELPVLQPERFRDQEFLKRLRELNADLFMVVAFRILPEQVFTMPPRGTVNLHASLLPKYRGAAPINWALIHGEKVTGVTTFFIEKQVDTGEILLQRSIEVPEDMTAGELHDRLAVLGAELVLETADGIEQGTLKPRKQEGEVTLAPKLTKELGAIDWARETRRIHNLVRGLSPIPGSYTFYKGMYLKILRTSIPSGELADASSASPGQIVRVAKNGPIDVRTGDGVISILEVQPEGKRAMSAGEFIRGYRIAVGERLEGG